VIRDVEGDGMIVNKKGFKGVLFLSVEKKKKERKIHKIRSETV